VSALGTAAEIAAAPVAETGETIGAATIVITNNEIEITIDTPAIDEVARDRAETGKDQSGRVRSGRIQIGRAQIGRAQSVKVQTDRVPTDKAPTDKAKIVRAKIGQATFKEISKRIKTRPVQALRAENSNPVKVGAMGAGVAETTEIGTATAIGVPIVQPEAREANSRAHPHSLVRSPKYLRVAVANPVLLRLREQSALRGRALRSRLSVPARQRIPELDPAQQLHFRLTTRVLAYC